MAEQFAFQKSFRYGSAVDRDKIGHIFPGGNVDGPGHDLFAHAAFTVDGDGGAGGGGHFLSSGQCRSHGSGIAGDVLKAELFPLCSR
jgi:hypothetical protein